MVDVMVLSVLSMQVGDGDSRMPIPIHRWAELIERGIEKEALYQDKIAELEAAIESTRDAAKKAELQALLAAEKEAMAREEARRMEEARLAAEARAEQALELSRAAEVEARSRQAERDLVAEDAERARERKEQALDQALSAEKEAAAAKERAELAQRELEQRLEQIAEIKVREAEMLKQARQAEFRAKQAEERAALIAETMEQVREDFESATEQERKYAELMAQARAAEAEVRGRSEVIEEELTEAKQLVEEKSQNIADMSGRMVGLEAAEREARKDLTVVKDELEKVEIERQQSVWVHRDNSIRTLDIFMEERDVRSENDILRNKLHLPLIELGGGAVLVSHFETLDLDWWEIQVDRNLIKLTYNLEPLDGEEGVVRNLEMLYSENEPRILYLPFDLEGREVKPLEAIGMEMLKKERIQKALLFKSDDPDASTEVKITPLLRDNYLSVSNIEESSPVKIKPGDYILTERGRFVGVMVTKEKCFVLPQTMPPAEETVGIPLIKTPDEEYYEDFVNGARILKDKVKELQKDSFWFF
jgi:chemotaxis protein histidine kinase CheA